MLLFRNGITIYISESGTTTQSSNLSEGEFEQLDMLYKSNFLSEIEILSEMGLDLSDRLLANSVKKDDRFLFKNNGVVYRKGINLSVPKLLLQEYLNADDERFAALDNFWMWCALNPDAEARNSLFDYLQNQNLNITDKGFIVTYRNVNVFQEGNKKLHDFIVSNHLKVKSIWKKSPKNYNVVESNGDYILKNTRATNFKDNVLGTLKNCYNNIKDITKTIYTDEYTGKERYIIGKESRMPREKCDANSHNSCSYGYHSGNKAFVHRSSFGTEGIMVLINPMDVVSVPDYNTDKMRSCAFMPIGLLEWDKYDTLIEPDIDVFEDIYTNISVSNLNERLENLDLEEFKINSLNIDNISDLHEIYTEEMQDVINKRTTIINDYDEE